MPGQFGEQYAGVQLKTQIIFQIAVLIYKAKHHREPECIAELVSSRNIGKMQENILFGKNTTHEGTFWFI